MVPARALRYALTLALAWSASACGDDDGAAPDGGGPTNDAGDDAGDAGTGAVVITPPADPAPPAPPVFTPCPPGWRVVTITGGIEACEPWPETGRATCPEGEVHRPGEPGCAPVSGACPAGDYADDLPASGTIYYVDATAPPAGDGTRTSPFRRIADALAAAGTSTAVVALAKGRYEEAFDLRGGVSLWGACAGETTIAPPMGWSAPTIRVIGGTHEIHSVHVVAASSAIHAFSAGTMLTLEGVRITGAGGKGIVAEMRGAVTGSDVSITDTLPHALNVTSGASLSLSRVVLRDSDDTGLYARDTGTTVTLEDVAIHGTSPRPSDGGAGFAAIVDIGASLTVRRGVLEENGEGGLESWNVGSSIDASDIVVRRNAGGATGAHGYAAHTTWDATMRLLRARFEDNRGHGVLVENCPMGGGSFDASDIVVERTRANAFGTSGTGMVLTCASRVRRARLIANQYAGLAVVNVQGIATLEDLVIADTIPSVEDEWGHGLEVLLGATATMRRLVVERNPTFGIYVEGMGTVATIEDVVVRETPGGMGDGLSWGRGISAQAYSRIIVARGRVEQSAQIGVFTDHSMLSLDDLRIADTAGRALNIQSLSDVTARRVVISRSKDIAVPLFGDTFWGHARLDATDVIIEDTTELLCDGMPCPGTGTALGVYGDDAHATLAQFEITRSVLAGLQIAGSDDPMADLRDGSVHGNLIGVNIQLPAYDVTRLQQNVRYYDNEVNLDSRSLPVPSPL